CADHAGDDGRLLKCQDRLADAGAMHRRGLDEGYGIRRFRRGVCPVDDDGLTPVENGEMDDMAADAGEGFDEGPRLAVQFHVRKHDISELEKLQAKSIAIPLAVLIEKTDFTHRGEKPVRGALGIFGTRAYFAKRHRPVDGREALEDSSDLDEGLEILIAPARQADLAQRVLEANGVVPHSGIGNGFCLRLQASRGRPRAYLDG